MKEIMMWAVVLTAMLSCQTKEKKAEGKVEVSATDRIEYRVYEGILPTDDGAGVRYHLEVGLLDNDKGEYRLTMTDLKDESDESYFSEGEVSTIEGREYSDGKIVYVLNPNDDSEDIYFIVKDDKRLRLVNSNLEEFDPSNSRSYDIYLVE